MTENIYSEIADTADEMLEEFGQIVTLTHITISEYVPGKDILSSKSTQTGTGVIVDWDAKQIDGTLIQVGDKKLLLSPLNTAGTNLTAPVLGDTVTDTAGVVYTLVAPLKTVSPAGTVVLFEVNIRV